MNIDELAKHLNASPGELTTVVTDLNNQYKLDIIGDDLTINQYHLVRSLLDKKYLVKLLSLKRSDRNYSYNSGFDYMIIIEHIKCHDFNKYSTEEVKEHLPSIVVNRSTRVISAALRECGYVTRTMTVETTGKQGRRWVKEVIEPSFM